MAKEQKQMNKPEKFSVSSPEVVCDGGGGSLGHPKVYLHINPEIGEIICPYCSRTYVLQQGLSASSSKH